MSFYSYMNYAEFQMFFGVVMARSYLYEQGYGCPRWKWDHDLEEILGVVRLVFPCSSIIENNEDYPVHIKIQVRDGSLAYLQRYPALSSKVVKLYEGAASANDDPADWCWVELKLMPTGASLELVSEENSWFPWRVAKGLLAVKKFALEAAPWTSE